MNTNNEIWKFIPNTKDRYQASSLGRIKSLTNPSDPIIMKARIDKYGYKRVGLYINKSLKTYCIHKLVMICFIGKTPRFFHIDHIDNNKHNNELINLQFLTVRQNISKSKKINKNSNLPIGVTLSGAYGYVSRIVFDKKRHYLGIYKTPEQASERYQEALRQINNGTFEIKAFRANYKKRQNSIQTQPKQKTN